MSNETSPNSNTHSHTFDLSNDHTDMIDFLIKKGIYRSRAEFFRDASRQKLREEYTFLNIQMN